MLCLCFFACLLLVICLVLVVQIFQLVNQNKYLGGFSQCIRFRYHMSFQYNPRKDIFHPVDVWPVPEGIDRTIQSKLSGSSSWDLWSPIGAWDWWVFHLPKASFEPEELDMLGSVSMTFCSKFNSTGEDQSLVKDVSPCHSTYEIKLIICWLDCRAMQLRECCSVSPELS